MSRTAKKRKWFSKLEIDTCGAEFYTFYALRESLESISKTAKIKAERLEALALDGQFEQCYKEYFYFINKTLPEIIVHFENEIKMDGPKHDRT